jgi:hypothetical protein
MAKAQPKRTYEDGSGDTFGNRGNKKALLKLGAILREFLQASSLKTKGV